jgi:hypothetical protein
MLHRVLFEQFIKVDTIEQNLVCTFHDLFFRRNSFADHRDFSEFVKLKEDDRTKLLKNIQQFKRLFKQIEFKEFTQKSSLQRAVFVRNFKEKHTVIRLDDRARTELADIFSQRLDSYDFSQLKKAGIVGKPSHNPFEDEKMKRMMSGDGIDLDLLSLEDLQYIKNITSPAIQLPCDSIKACKEARHICYSRIFTLSHMTTNAELNCFILNNLHLVEKITIQYIPGAFHPNLSLSFRKGMVNLMHLVQANRSLIELKPAEDYRWIYFCMFIDSQNPEPVEDWISSMPLEIHKYFLNIDRYNSIAVDVRPLIFSTYCDLLLPYDDPNSKLDSTTYTEPARIVRIRLELSSDDKQILIYNEGEKIIATKYIRQNKHLKNITIMLYDEIVKKIQTRLLSKLDECKQLEEIVIYWFNKGLKFKGFMNLAEAYERALNSLKITYFQNYTHKFEKNSKVFKFSFHQDQKK